jgi:hypothetical protein
MEASGDSLMAYFGTGRRGAAWISQPIVFTWLFHIHRTVGKYPRFILLNCLAFW